jgi:glycosyltransferase involved in cell wall biosynthesis
LSELAPPPRPRAPARILNVIPWPVFGGAHNEALRIGDNAPRDEWSILVLLPPEADRAAGRFEAKGVAVRRLPMARLRRTVAPGFWLTYPLRFATDVFRLMRIIRRERIDLVEGSSVNLQGALAALLTGTACVWRLADITAPSPLRRFVAAVLPYLADEILVNGNATRGAYPGLEQSRVPVISYFPMIDDLAFRPDPREKANPAIALVGTVANINPDKGIDLFVEAAGRLAHHQGVNFLVIGAEHDSHRGYARRVQDLATELAISDRITFVGEQSDVASWMRRMDVFVISSRREGTTTTAIEAMASGLAIVATDVGAVHEVIEDGRTGHLVPPGDPEAMATTIAELLDDPERRAQLGTQARREFERRFSTSDLLASRLATYTRVLARRQDLAVSRSRGSGTRPKVPGKAVSNALESGPTRRQTTAPGRRPRVVFIIQAPTPYTTAIMSALDRRVSLHVVYMRRPGRRPDSAWVGFRDPWGSEPSFEHSFYPSVQVHIRSQDFLTHAWVGISALLTRVRPDVVVMDGWGQFVVEPLIWSRVFQRRVVLWAETHARSGIVRGPFSNLLRRRMFRAVHSVITNGRLATEFAVSLGADPARIVTSCLPSAAVMDIAPRTAVEEPAGARFLFVGRLTASKRPTLALNAFSRISGELPGATLTFVGDGPEAARTLAAAAPHNGRVRLLGRMEGSALDATYAEHDILVAPFVREVWGLVLNEALAAGLFVIASDEVGSAATLLNDQSGIIVPPDDPQALANAMRVAADRLDRSDEARSMRQAQVANCTPERFADDLVRAIEIAIGGTSR